MLQKIEHYISALAQLEQAVAIYQKSQQDALYRDGLIQRFEFTVELAWKSIKEYLEDQGSTTPIATPRAVLKEAFAAGVIQRNGTRSSQPATSPPTFTMKRPPRMWPHRYATTSCPC